MIICLLNQAGSATSAQGGPTVSPGTRWCSTTSLLFVMRLGAHFIVTCKQASCWVLATRASIADSEQWSAACSAGDADMNCWELDYESITEVFIWISARPYPTLVTYQSDISYISYNVLKFCKNESILPPNLSYGGFLKSSIYPRSDRLGLDVSPRWLGGGTWLINPPVRITSQKKATGGILKATRQEIVLYQDEVVCVKGWLRVATSSWKWELNI